MINMNEEITVILDNKERLYDYCENIEQLYDKFYLPLVNHVNWLQKQNAELKKENEKLKNEPLTNKISRIDSVIANIYRENERLRKNGEHNDKVVDKVNWENKRLKNNWNELKELLNRYTHDEYFKVSDMKKVMKELEEKEVQ